MIKLYQFPPLFGVPNLSPFCVKVETYLRLAGISYHTVILHSPGKAPKGKLPYITDGEKTIADSSFIIEYLKEHYGDKLDADLTPTQKALALAVQHLLEEHLYWEFFYERWVADEGFAVMYNKIFSKMPLPFRWFIPTIVRNKFTKACYAQGIGRFTSEERFHLGKKDIDAIVVLLGSHPFFLGDKPTSIDAVLWGCLTPLLNAPIPSALKDYAKTIPTLVNYDHRMRELFDSLVSLKVG